MSEGATQSPNSLAPRPRSTRRTWFIGIGAACAIVWGGCYSLRRWLYPYGPSHACDKILYFALKDYAEAHDGWFPKGEATPEASMSLLYKANNFAPDCAFLLCGKRLKEAAIKPILERGERLTPETCGWNYVEGLRPDDDRMIALFWDKEGLGHNGERNDAGGHIVMFVNGFTQRIPETDWPRFLADQEKLRADAAAKRAAAEQSKTKSDTKHVDAD